MARRTCTHCLLELEPDDAGAECPVCGKAVCRYCHGWVERSRYCTLTKAARLHGRKVTYLRRHRTKPAPESETAAFLRIVGPIIEDREDEC